MWRIDYELALMYRVNVNLEYELNEMYLQKAAIGAFSNGFNWSSPLTKLGARISPMAVRTTAIRTSI